MFNSLQEMKDIRNQKAQSEDASEQDNKEESKIGRGSNSKLLVNIVPSQEQNHHYFAEFAKLSIAHQILK